MKTLYLKDARVGSMQLTPPTDALIIEDGASKVSGSVNALHTTGVELNNPELRENSQTTIWKAKQQLLGLLKVCSGTYVMGSHLPPLHSAFMMRTQNSWKLPTCCTQ